MQIKKYWKKRLPYLKDKKREDLIHNKNRKKGTKRR